MRFSTAITTAALAVGAAADNYMGFNSGSTKADGSAKVKADFVSEFTTAQKLAGTNGKFNSFRMYTNIQAGTQTDPIEAFEAAVETKTNLLLGIWGSGTDNINNELAALKNAIKSVDGLSDIVIGISIGSEDLYRDGATGRSNKAGVGAGPEVIAGFIKDYKNAVKGTGLENVPVGHVDTWDAWTNTTNKVVIDAVDFLGVDEYPYYESTETNTIDNAYSLFNRAYQATVGVAGGKKVWVTETGWPYEGIKWHLAVPSVSNAKKFWDQVGCGELFGETPTFWYNLEDTNAENKQSFAVYDPSTSKPRFDLSCPKKSAVTSTSAAASHSATHTSTAKDGEHTKTSSASGSSTTSNSSSGSGSGSGSNSSSSASSSGSDSATTTAATTTVSTPTSLITSVKGDATTAAGDGSAADTTDTGSTTGTATETTASPSPTTSSAMASFQGLPKLAYAGLAIAAGIFAML